MNKLNLDEEDIENAYLLARLGSEYYQKILLDYFLIAAESLTISYSHSLKNSFGPVYEELKELVYLTFEKMMLRDYPVYNCLSFFKFLYIQQINTYIRDKHTILDKEVTNDNLILLLNEDNISSLPIDHKEYQNGHEILDIIYNDKRSRLSKREKEVINLFILGYGIKDIAKKIGICYAVTFRYLKSGFKKCEEYIKRFLPEAII